jgi:hypothetical protein
VGLLSVLLIFAGVERRQGHVHQGGVVRDAPILCTAMPLVGGSSVALGFLCAMVAH